MARPGFHEEFEQETVAPGSDRAFGLVFVGFCALVGASKLWHGHVVGVVWCAAALLLLAVAVVRPALLAPFNYLWLKLGLLLSTVLTPVVMALMFYLTILPMGLLMRVFRDDPLCLKRDPQARSYWIERRPPGPPPDTMRNQF